MGLRADLADVARRFYARGWMAGTSGNLSARKDDGGFWITASGRSKGSLVPEDFLKIGVDGTVERELAARRPSAETSIHHMLYRLMPDARAILHVHTVEANLVCRMSDPVRLPPLEMLKGFDLWAFEPTVHVDVFRNSLDVPSIAAEVGARYGAALPDVPGFLIRDHGLTTWGASIEQAFNRAELFDYLFRYLVAARASRIDPWSTP